MPVLATGSRISHFTILAKLGEGGMGIVYKARDNRLDRLVAIKVLPQNAVADAEREARFVQEAKAASALNHPNIITIHEIDAVDGATFIAMEYVDGRTLDEVVPRKGLRFTEALRYAVQITDALAAAHRIGIVHRDLKPANIMIPAQGPLKVLDFGLAKLVQSGASEMTATTGAPHTAEGSLIGTTPYMSPEQAVGKPVDARSDIFSFGIVLYAMLTGQRPFTGDTQLSTLAAIVHAEPAPAGKSVDDVPPELDRILSRCLRKDPARRFQTMADLHVALEELKDESDSGSLTKTTLPGRPRKRVWIWAAAAVLVVLVPFAFWLAKSFGVAVVSPKLVPLTTYAGSEGNPSFSPDGKQVAFNWDGEKGDNVDIYVKLVGESNALRLTTDPATDAFPAWSPDGRRIAFERSVSSRQAGIYTMSPLGGGEQKLTDFPGNSHLSWSPDGKWLAAAANTPEWSGIFLLPIEGGDARRITSPKAPEVDVAPSFSPNGRRLAYAICIGDYSCDVYVQELNPAYVPQGAARRITREGITVTGLAWTRDGASVIFDSSRATGILQHLWRVDREGRGAPQRLEIAGPGAISPSIDSTGGRLVFSKVLRDSDIWSYHVGGGMDPLIVSSLADYSPQFSPDGTRIAFESNRSGEAVEIWVSHADGSGLVQVTDRLGRHQGSPRWSPDGRWIAFDSQGNDGHWDIYVVDATGGRPRRFTSDPSDENLPSWSHDGKWVYFASDRTGRYEIWRAPFAGDHTEQVTVNGGYISYESVDGKTLFFNKANSSPLFAQPLSGGPERQVLPSFSYRAFVPVEDGIYFIGQGNDEGHWPLQFFEFASGTSRLLTKIDGHLFHGLSVSPDRKTILFTKMVAFGADLMMIENFQ